MVDLAGGDGSPQPFGTGTGLPLSGPKQRGRVRWGRVVAGVAAILLLAVPCLVLGIVAAAGGPYLLRRDAVVSGRAPGTLTFDAGTGRYVVALSAEPDGTLFDGLTRTERRQRYRVTEGEQADARCTVTHPDGTTSELRGDRQATGTFVGNTYATVGEFTGKGGTTSVACRFDPAEDLIGNVVETPVMVHPANAVVQYLGMGLILGSLVLGGLGTLLILWGTVWRRPKTPAAG